MNNATVKNMLRDQDPYVRRDACFAVSESRNGELIPELVEVLGDENPGVKEAALNALISIGGRSVAEAVCPMLRLENVSLRNVAIEILQQIGTAGLKTISSMLNDPDDDVVKFAVDILAGIREAEGVRLLSPLAGHRNPNVRGSVAVCLGRIKAEGSAQILLNILNDSEEWVRFSAIEGLGLLKDASALGPLLDIIENERGLLREAAIDAVSRVANGKDAARALDKISSLLMNGHVINIAPVVDLMEKASAPGSGFRPGEELAGIYYGFFCSALDEVDLASRLKAVKGLGLLRRAEGIGKVLDLACSLREIDENAEAVIVEALVSLAGRGPLPAALKKRLAAVDGSFGVIIKALKMLRCEEAVPLLEQVISKVNRQELREVVTAIEAIGSAGSVQAMYNALNSTDGHTRKTAARALSSLAGESAVERLFEALKAECYRDVQEEITDVIAVIPSDRVKSAFCELLADEREGMREMGARGLGMIGDEEVLRNLEKAAKDPSPAVRKAAYKSLAKLGIPDAVELILEGLKDAKDDVRLSVLKALGGWTGERIKEALVKVLSDGNLWVRYQAVNLIGDLGERDTEGVLLSLLENDEPPVKAAAACALGKTGSVESIKKLEKFAEHQDPKVREAVREAIESLKCLLSD